MINDIIQLLGVANPQLSNHWSNGAPANLSDSQHMGPACLAVDNFVAPLNGYLTKGRELERIIMPGGGTPQFGSSFLIRVDPQVFLRITRLYSTIIEGKLLLTHLPERPVPCYFVYTGVNGKKWTDADGKAQTGPAEGLVFAGQDLLASGLLTIHDQYGFPIDPLAVAAAFDAFMHRFATMETKLLTTPSAAAPVTAASQLTLLAGTVPTTTIQLCAPNGDAILNAPTLFANLSANTSSAEGFYTINTPATAMTKKAGTGADVRIGAATNGLLGNAYTATGLAAGLTLNRDFLRAYVVNLNSYLLGNVPATEASVVYSTGALVRDNEQITLLADGTECLGAVGAINASGGTPRLFVSPAIDTDFVLPQMVAGIVPRWPAAPVGGAGSTGNIPATLKQGFVLTASFINDTVTVNSDVALLLTCAQFAPGDWVRIYNRVFHENGSETRGDGGGAMIDAGKTAAFRLTDPFARITNKGQATTLNNPTLMLDVVLINRGGTKRTFGNVQCIVGAAAALPAQLPTAPLNTLGNAPELGTSPAGISGTAYAPQNPTGGNAGGFLGGMLGEGQPREAPRYPTMARYDSIAASYSVAPKSWQAFCGGTIFKKDALSSFPFKGNPGSPGGREFGSVGIHTAGGLLAYDLARAAYRRTRNIAERMGNMMTGTTAAAWQPPTPVAAATATWAAATLQTIAPHCETPELGLQFTDASVVPTNLPAFIALLQNKLGGIPGWLPAAVRNQIQNAINGQANDPQNQLAYAELYQEIVTSLNGRRDTYWALKQAISDARECIYIQGNLLDHTALPADGQGMIDLIDLIKSRLDTYPRLKLILCFSRQIRYGKGYEAFEAHDYARRKEIVDYLMGDVNPVTHIAARANQVVVFHPDGFPMRPKELRHQLVLIDDMWALIGSSSIRRRGFVFDGAQDVVAFDKTIVNGKSAGIRTLRLKLLTEHLNLQGVAGLTPGLKVRLRDLRESFYAIKELLDSGGAGLISPLWNGDRQDLTPAVDDLANPNGTFSGTDALLTAILGGTSTAL